MDSEILKRKNSEYYAGRFRYDNQVMKILEIEVGNILALNDSEGNPPSLEDRRIIIDALFDAYIEQVGEVPPGNQVQRLGNWIILEDLTDSRPDKVAKEDYPIMTKRQMRTRYRREMANEHIPETVKTMDDNLAKKKNTIEYGGY